MPEIKISHAEMKYMTSQIYEYCHKLFGDEFKDMYAKPKLEFTDWLNDKTGLKERLILNPVQATIHWYNALDKMMKIKVRS